MTVLVNGTPTDLADGTTVADLLVRLDLAPEARGVAVAVDAEVVPRGEWERRALSDGAKVEVLQAVGGGS